MNFREEKRLFEALARLDSPLYSACERAIDAVRNREHVSEIERAKAKEAVTNLLKGNQQLHDYLRKIDPQFDFIGEGNELFLQIRNKEV